MGVTSNRKQEFRKCEICAWVCLCTRIERGSVQQPRQNIEQVPPCIWLCVECYDRSNELWQRKKP